MSSGQQRVEKTLYIMSEIYYGKDGEKLIYKYKREFLVFVLVASSIALPSISAFCFNA